MLRSNLCRAAIFSLTFVSTLTVWCADGEGTSVTNVIELELIKKQAIEREKWKSQGAVSRQEVLGYYQYWPFDFDAFWLKADGTGLLYGGVRGTGTWRIMWEYHEQGSMLVIQSVQVKRQYKVIKKDGKVWMIEGREVWRQGIEHNAPLMAPRDRVQRAAEEPPAKRKSVL